MTTKLVFGCGYLGSRVANRWLTNGDTVTVVTRSDRRAEELQSAGFAPIVADVTQPNTLRSLPSAETVLFAVGFDRSAGGSINDVYAGGMQSVLGALPKDVKRFIYISTTGVYGPAGGEWVDEDTPTDPRRDGGRASLAAEQLLARHPLGRQSAILRLAGIYGPDRIPFLKELRAGEPIAAPSKGYLNLIHVEDAAEIVVATDHWLDEQKDPQRPQIFCVSDGHPVARIDYYSEVARLINADRPTFIVPEPGSPRAARAEVNRRIKNDRLLSELGIKLAYPTYRDGLHATIETQNQKL